MFKMALRPLLASALLATLFAEARAGELPQRSQNVVVYGDDKCPTPVGDEAVVCGRRPEGERYRIPKELRQAKEDRPNDTSWTSRVEGLEEAGRPSMPGSCSVVGSGGQTGCAAQMMREWFAARRSRR